MKYVIAALIIGSVVAAGLLWLQTSLSNAERDGIDKQVAADIAKANQELAVKRERDAKFDKMDARAFCLDAGFEWLFIDGKSLCR